MARFFVTGGAGFVGSHIVAKLLQRGAAVCVFDNLQQGHREAVLPGARLIVGDLADEAALNEALADGPWDGVLHFAALSLVGESMAQPCRYLLENGMHGIRLIDACVRHKVPRFVLSSTASLFGQSDGLPIPEDAPIDPGSPYGESKWIIERALLWAHRIHGLASASLRYFNAAGADPAGRLGEDHRPETHLIPLAIDAVLERRPPLQVFGRDYPTPDGTCIRDYIHVDDLAEAHVRVLDHLDHGCLAFNVGTGQGHSVQAVLDSVSRIAGRPVPTVDAPRRPGDPAVLVAATARLHKATGWSPALSALDECVRTAFLWRQRHPDGYRMG